jgi:hypothetical protein
LGSIIFQIKNNHNFIQVLLHTRPENRRRRQQFKKFQLMFRFCVSSNPQRKRRVERESSVRVPPLFNHNVKGISMEMARRIGTVRKEIETKNSQKCDGNNIMNPRSDPLRSLFWDDVFVGRLAQVFVPEFVQERYAKHSLQKLGITSRACEASHCL